MNKAEIISRHAQALKGQVGTSLTIDECEDIMKSLMNEAINFIRCSTQLPDQKELIIELDKDLDKMKEHPMLLFRHKNYQRGYDAGFISCYEWLLKKAIV